MPTPGATSCCSRSGLSRCKGELSDYHLYALLAPHLGNHGWDNTAWLGEFKGHPLLLAEANGSALALACSRPWRDRSAGFVGVSDGWQDLHRHKQLAWHYDRAENGNVALTGEIDLTGSDGTVVLALGFGQTVAEAALRAIASLQGDITQTKARYIEEWQEWQTTLRSVATGAADAHARSLFLTSAAILRTHEAKRFPGGVIASLSIPWGFTKGDDDLGGYHLVWPRDLVETAGGLLAAGAGRMRAASSTTSSPRRRRTVTGRRICGWTARPIGPASRWTKPPFPSCSSIWRGGKGP